MNKVLEGPAGDSTEHAESAQATPADRDEYGPLTPSADKPHLGRIRGWWKYECDNGLGYLIRGEFLDHPSFAGALDGHTSYVVKHEGDEIETRNSRYTLTEPRRAT